MPQSGGPATDMATVFFPLGVLERLGMVIDMSCVIDMSWNVVVYLNFRGETGHGNSMKQSHKKYHRNQLGQKKHRWPRSQSDASALADVNMVGAA